MDEEMDGGGPPFDGAQDMLGDGALRRGSGQVSTSSTPQDERVGVGVGVEPTFLAPGNNRRMQERRGAARELFDDAKKEEFLDLLATNCNVDLSCEEAGIGVTTVYRHRRIDPAFRDGWWQALEQGAAKLVALRLQRELERAGRPAAAAAGDRDGGAQPTAAPGGQSTSDCPLAPAMDGPPDARQIADLYKLIGLLREHARGLGGGSKPGAAPAAVPIADVAEKLVRKLKGLGVRVAGSGGESGGEAGA